MSEIESLDRGGAHPILTGMRARSETRRGWHRDLSSPALLWLKALLFVLTGTTAAVLLIWRSPSWTTALLVVVCVFGFSHAYYFCFYVLERYLGRSQRVSGLGAGVTILLGRRDDGARAALEQAKKRLDQLDLYPQPVSLQGVRLRVAPWLFRLPWFRRFDGYAAHRLILLRSAALVGDNDLVTHELCHVWQMQHRPLAMPLSYLGGYSGNRYEIEATRAAQETTTISSYP